MWDQEIAPLKKILSIKSRKFSVIAELAHVSTTGLIFRAVFSLFHFITENIL